MHMYIYIYIYAYICIYVNHSNLKFERHLYLYTVGTRYLEPRISRSLNSYTLDFIFLYKSYKSVGYLKQVLSVPAGSR